MISVTRSKEIQKNTAIDFADTQLELAHRLCETAAYHAMRTDDGVSEIDRAAKNPKQLLETANEVRCLTEVMQQKTKGNFAKDPPTSIAARLTSVAVVAAREPPTVETSVIEVDDTSYLSAESVNQL